MREPAKQLEEVVVGEVDVANENAISEIRRLIATAKQEISEEHVTVMMGAVAW